MVQLSTDISQTEFFFLSHSFCCDILKWAFFCYNQQQRVMKGRRSSVGRVPRHGTDVGLNPWSGKGFFSQSQLSVQTLLVSVKPPPVHLHISTCVCTLKIPNAGRHTIVWTQENCRH